MGWASRCWVRGFGEGGGEAGWGLGLGWGAQGQGWEFRAGLG